MAHFAEIDGGGLVLRVVVVPDSQESRGAEFLAQDLRLGGIWVQCSYSGAIRKQFPGVGYRYDAAADMFVAPQPFPSWSLDAAHDWQPPVAKPAGLGWLWDEESLSWRQGV